MISSLGIASAGLAGATSRFDRASTRIAQPEPTDLIGDRVDQIVAQHDVEANLATVRTSDELLGTLINTIA